MVSIVMKPERGWKRVKMGCVPPFISSGPSMCISGLLLVSVADSEERL